MYPLLSVRVCIWIPYKYFNEKKIKQWKQTKNRNKTIKASNETALRALYYFDKTCICYNVVFKSCFDIYILKIEHIHEKNVLIEFCIRIKCEYNLGSGFYIHLTRKVIFSLENQDQFNSTEHCVSANCAVAFLQSTIVYVLGEACIKQMLDVVTINAAVSAH